MAVNPVHSFMRLFRRLVIVLLAIALPSYGMAAVAIASPCPMQMADTPTKGTCCENSDHAKSGNPCKAGQECQTGALYQSVESSVMGFVPPSSVQVNTSSLSVIAATPTSVWRPPRTL